MYFGMTASLEEIIIILDIDRSIYRDIEIDILLLLY